MTIEGLVRLVFAAALLTFAACGSQSTSDGDLGGRDTAREAGAGETATPEVDAVMPEAEVEGEVVEPLE